MDFILTYILQVNLLLIIIYLGYVLMLKNLTFYQINRGYFILGAVFSFVYPFLDIKSLFRKHIDPVGEMIHFIPEFFIEEASQESVFTLNNLSVVILGIGAGVFILRLLLQLFSLLRIHMRSEPAMWKSFLYRNVLFPIVPFSFFNNVYINKEQHQEHELMDIFKHEDVHVKGRHTVDILFTEIVFITCWYNPVVWLMRKAVRQNLEFLTDQQVLDKGVDRQVYQYSLLNVSRQGQHASIANQFNFKMLKRRIMMMNKKRSSRLELGKYVFLIPVLVFVAGALTVNQAEAGIENIVEKGKAVSLDLHLPKSDEATVMADTIAEADARVEGNVVGLTIVNQADTSRRPRIVLRGATINNGEQPLVVVDGKEMTADYDISLVDASNIERVTVLKDASAIAEYGEKAKNGVVLVETKKAAGKLSDTTKARLRGVTGSIRIVQGRLIDSLGNEKKPLMILDGERVTDDLVLSKVNPHEIESIDVLKDGAHTALYGDDGKDGVIIIRTKKEELQPKAITVRGYPTKSSKPLVIVNGKEVELDLNSIKTEKIESIKTLTPEEATALYGDNGKQGAVIIITKVGEDVTQLQRPSVSGTEIHEVLVVRR